MPEELSDRELRLLRMRSQRLLPGSQEKTVAGAAAAALTIQAQDVPAATLGVRARTAGLSADAARRQAARKTACRSWLMRNTIFLFATKDLAWMRPLLAERPLAQAERRLGQLGGRPAAERTLADLPGRLAEGPLPRSELREMLAERGDDTGEVFYWTAHAAALRGILVARPALEREQTYVAAPPDEPLDRDEALGRLARRYLGAYGPATPADFAYWAKMPKRDAAIGWERAGRTVEVQTGRGAMTALPGGLDLDRGAGPVISLLGAWDHYLLGWESGRELSVPQRHQRAIHPGAGYIKATALADGLAFATWKLERHGDAIEIAVKPFAGLPRGVPPGLEAEVADLGRFFGAEAKLRVARV